MYGDDSWELDALEPNYIVSLVEGHIKQHIDTDLWGERQDEIGAVQRKLQAIALEFED